MVRAEFEEKEYETFANVELYQLGRRGPLPPLWTPGQVLEATLGYDAAANVRLNKSLRRAMALPPRRHARMDGVTTAAIYPARGQYANIPRFVASLFIQYKRPDRMSGRGQSAHLWNGQRYYRARIETDSNQYRILRDLDQMVHPRAVVRYAAPAFHTRTELFASASTHAVLERTAFLRPVRLKDQHTYWTYRMPGSMGLWNPAGDASYAESIDQMVENLSDRQESETLQSHLRELFLSIAEADHLGLTDSDRRLLDAFLAPNARIGRHSQARAILAISGWVVRQRLTWRLIAQPHDRYRAGMIGA